jgi:pimeloyl-ACP methyl ester carboxylesterase
MSEIQEQAYLLGPRRSLVGVYSRPAGLESGRRPAVVILNAGILHRVGANRLHVVLARALAARGFPVLRFDLSGIGDSAPREDALPLLDAGLADIREALDELDSLSGAKDFILAGLCSGAVHALLAGEADPRVKGVVMLDLFVPRTRGFYVRHYLRRSLNFRGLARFLVGRHPSWQRIRARMQRALSPDDNTDAVTSRMLGEFVKRTRTAFTTLVRRDVKLIATFTSGLPGQHNYPGQLAEAFPEVDFGRLLRVEYFRETDHTFTLVQNQARLLSVLTEWAESEFPARAPAAAPEAATRTAPLVRGN